jgi:hypothetical protein
VDYQKVYLLDQASGVIILDLSNIEAPQVIGRYKAASTFTKLATEARNPGTDPTIVLSDGSQIVELAWGA